MVERSYFTLTTANGCNATLVDARSGAIRAVLDHPYRYLRPGPGEADFGVERRNLLADAAFRVDGRPLGAPVAAGYAEESNVVEMRFEGGMTLQVVAPFGLRLNAVLIVLAAPGAGSLDARLACSLGLPPVAEPFWRSPFGIVPAGGERSVAAFAPGAWLERGPGAGALLFLPLGATAARADPEGSVAFEAAGPCLACLLAYVDDPDAAGAALRDVEAWRAGADPAALIGRELRAWAAWRRPTPDRLAPDERLVWRQSEAVLRMAQMREPAVDGMILASLPPGEWSIGWVRDGAYATVALARAGYHAEARRALMFVLANRKTGRYRAHVGGVAYRVSLTRYFGDGTEEADYAGHATPNIELDGWGLVLWAARSYVEASGDRAWLGEPIDGGTVYAILEREVAGALAAQIEHDPRVVRPDSSIWEVHQENARHYLYTSATAARGLADFARLAGLAGREAERDRYAALARAIAAAIPPAFRAEPEGHLMGARERSAASDVDGAVIEYFALGVAGGLETPLARRTYAALEALRLPSGGYRRCLGAESYSASEWAFVNLRLATVLERRGRAEAARRLLDLTTARAAANFGLIPETYEAGPAEGAGRYSGSIPMAGYGAGLYILAQLERGGAADPCADPI